MNEETVDSSLRKPLPGRIKFVCGVFFLLGLLFLLRALPLKETDEAFIALGVGCIFIVIGFGLYKRHIWARRVALTTLVLAALIHSVTIYGVFIQPVLAADHAHINIIPLLAMLMVLVLFLCCLYILLRGDTKTIFKRSG